MCQQKVSKVIRRERELNCVLVLSEAVKSRPRIVDKNIDGWMSRDDVGGRCADLLLLGQISPQEFHIPSARQSTQRRNNTAPCFRPSPEQHEVGTGGTERPSGGMSDSRGGTGDNAGTAPQAKSRTAHKRWFQCSRVASSGRCTTRRKRT
jgi:hypothetical protein